MSETSKVDGYQKRNWKHDMKTEDDYVESTVKITLSVHCRFVCFREDNKESILNWT